MSRTIVSSVNVSKLDLINSEASAPFKELEGKSERVKGAAIVREEDAETGEPKLYSYLYTENAVYAGNSATVRKAVESLIDLLSDENIVLDATVTSRPTKSGRDFLTISFKEVK